MTPHGTSLGHDRRIASACEIATRRRLFPMAERALGDERLRELEEATAGACV